MLRTAVPFEGPDACAIIGNGSIVVAEFVGRRVQLLSRSGRLLQVFKGHTSGSNGGNRAALERRALCLTPARVPARQATMECISGWAKVLLIFSVLEQAGSSLPFCQLSGVVAGDGHVFVSDFDHDLIHVFEVVRLECTLLERGVAA